MTTEEQAIASAYDAELLKTHGTRPCGDARTHANGAETPTLSPRGDSLDQSGPLLAAVTWECGCGWKRTEPRRTT